MFIFDGKLYLQNLNDPENLNYCPAFRYSALYSQDYYSELRKKYWEYGENDRRAFTYLNLYISSAKKEKDYAELFQAYDHAIWFSADQKLKYADSAIAAAIKSQNKDLIGRSHMGKGVVYYFNYRKFQPALDEYLTAYRYLENAEDPYVKYQNLYHIGVVKSYLGYHDEALQIFKECIAYFEPNTRANIHPNLILNNQKGYLNSLHQMIICYQAIGKFDEAKRFTEEAFSKIPRDNTFYLEKSYFEKAEGITDFNQKKYEESINKLTRSLPALMKINNFTFLSVVYFYKGQSYAKLGDQIKAVENYKKVDSIFNKHQFILPEIRKNYEELITYYKDSNNPVQELYYTKQLLKADEIIANDFKYLSTRIHKDYDTRNLLEAKADLEHTNSYGKILLIGCVLVITLLVFIVAYWFKRKREIQRQYDKMLLKIKSAETSTESLPPLKVDIDKSSKLEPLLVQKLLKKISDFEKSNSFLEKGISLNRLASQFETNTSYLSQVINEYKGNNFNTYINKLRIMYATDKLYTDKEWRKKSVEDIA